MDLKKKDFNKTTQKHLLFYYTNIFHKVSLDKPLQELIFFRKVLPGFNFASLIFPKNMQGFKFEKKKKKCGVHVLVGI